MAVLAVFAGLPGVGKSTLAGRVAAVLPATVLAVDTVDAALRRYDVSEPRPGYAAYGAVLGLAETQLRTGGSVLIDAVNPVRATRRNRRMRVGRRDALARGSCRVGEPAVG